MKMDELLSASMRKAAIIGALSALGAWLGFGSWIGVSAAVGAALVLVNVAAIAWLIRKMLERASQGMGAGLIFGALFMLKLLALFWMTYYCIARLGMSPVGFALGYGAFPAGLVWQAVEDLVHPRAHMEDDETPPDDPS
jgi:hypothetical protein